MSQAEELSPLWDGAIIYDGGWIYSDWYGYLFPQGEWVLHLEHNWQYCLGDDPDNVFIYDFGIESWAYSSAALYPWIYWYGNVNDWTYYYRNGRVGNRWFYLPATGEYRNDSTLNGAVFVEGTPRDFPVTGGSDPLRITDPVTSLVFETPVQESGTIRIATLEEAPLSPFPGTGLAIDVSGMDQLNLIVPADQLPGDTFPMVYVYGEVQGSFDDEIGYRERWIGLPYTQLPDGSYSFELPIAPPDSPGLLNSDSWPQLKDDSGERPRHYFISKIDSSMPDYAQRNNVELQVEAYLLDFLGAVKPTRASAVSNRRQEAFLSITYGGNAYTGFNKLRAWSFGRSFLPVINIESPLKTSALAHETGHYLTHLLVGHDVYDSLEKAGGSLFSSTHGIRESIGRNNLLEDYAYIIEYFLKDYGGNSDLKSPHITFGGMSSLTSDFPGLEGFAATMLACLNISSSSMRNYLGNTNPISPLGLDYSDIFEIMSKGATSVDTLRSNIESSLSADKRKALQVMLQRIGWSYYVRGTLLDDKDQPIVGAAVRNIIKIGDTEFEGESSNVPSKADGSFVLTGSVFGGDSFVEVTLGEGQVINVPISIEWTEPTEGIIELGPLVVAENDESVISFSTDYGYDGWPPNFMLNLSADLKVEIQGLDNASYRVEKTEDFQAHEPWINIVVYASTGSNITITGTVSVTPSAMSGSYEDELHETVNWTFEDQYVYATPPDFKTPVGTGAELEQTVSVSSGLSGMAVFMLNGSIMKGTSRSSGVQARINISVVGE